jgi:menaquinol-cytochrome c reductase iron-sulfur subunit
MSNNEQHEGSSKEMTRRQFLSYALGGAGAFMAAGVALPMIRVAAEPLLAKKADLGKVKVISTADFEAKALTEGLPLKVEFKVTRQDGWYENEQTNIAFLNKDAQGNVYALSNICKHLGCPVNWNAGMTGYLCPCHGATYAENGKVLTVAMASLDQHDVSVEEGWIYLSAAVKPNVIAQ